MRMTLGLPTVGLSLVRHSSAWLMPSDFNDAAASCSTSQLVVAPRVPVSRVREPFDCHERYGNRSGDMGR